MAAGSYGAVTALFTLRATVPMLTLTQLSSNGSCVWLNRRELHWRLIGWFALGAISVRSRRRRGWVTRG